MKGCKVKEVDLEHIVFPVLSEDNLTIVANYFVWRKLIFAIGCVSTPEIDIDYFFRFYPVLDKLGIKKKGYTSISGTSAKWLSLITEIQNFSTKLKSNQSFDLK
jgi:hypothetical protein